MKIETRRIGNVYNIKAEWEDRETFKIILEGETRMARPLQFEAIVRFDFLPYFLRDLTKQWLESKRRRLAAIKDVDEWLPPRGDS